MFDKLAGGSGRQRHGSISKGGGGSREPEFKLNAKKYLRELSTRGNGSSPEPEAGLTPKAGLWRSRGLGCISHTGRDRRCGIRIVDEQPHSQDLLYTVNWCTQEKKAPALSFSTANKAFSPPEPAAVPKLKRMVRVTGGTIGLCYPDPSAKHTPGPSIGAQVGRDQENKVGYTGTDTDTLVRQQRQHPLKVRYSLVESRPCNVPIFHSSAKRCPRGKADEEGWDLLPFTTAASAHIPGAFDATKRPLARAIRFGPGFRSGKKS